MLSPFREHKLRHLFNLYDVQKNGVLTIDDFIMMIEAGAQAMGATYESYEEVDFGGNLGVWDNIELHCDLNHDGVVTEDEFVEGYARWMETSDFDSIVRANVASTMAAADLNSDGVITRDEFMIKLHLGTGDMFDQLDIDGNGFLTEDEFFQHTLTFYYSEDPSEPGNQLCGPLDW